MATRKISDLPAGSALSTTQIPVMNAGVTQKITLSQITVDSLTSGNAAITLGSDGILTLPPGGDIVDSTGNSVLSAGTVGFSTGNLVVGGAFYGLDSDAVSINTLNENDPIILNPQNGLVELGIFGGPTVSLKFQDGTTQSTAYLPDNKLSSVLWVSPTGNNTGANGTAQKPFATIQAAHDYAAANLTATTHVVIRIAPGTYAGVTLTRPRTHLSGFASMSQATRLIGSITINPTTVVEGVYNSTFNLEHLLVSPSSGSALVVTGDQVLSVMGHRVKFWIGNQTQSVMQVNNTAAAGVRMEFVDCTFQNEASSGITCDMSNVFAGTFKLCNFYGGSNVALKTTNCTLTLNSTGFWSSGTDVLSLNGSSVITAGNCSFSNSKANSNGVNIAAGATAVIGQCAFDVPAGTGYAIKGVAGAVLVHASNIITYGKNNKLSSAITALPMGTSFTPTA